MKKMTKLPETRRAGADHQASAARSLGAAHRGGQPGAGAQAETVDVMEVAMGKRVKTGDFMGKLVIFYGNS